MVVLAYLVLRSALTVEELTNYTGLDQKAIRKAVKGLASKHLLLKQRAAHGRELWVPMGQTLFSEIVGQLAQNGQTAADVVNDASLSEYKSDASLLLIKGQVAALRQPGEKIVSVTVSVKTPEEIAECLDALHSAGIFGGKAEKLADLNWITPEYIRAHVAQVQVEKWDRPLGMAIYRMETQQPAPELEENGHVVGCMCAECYRAEKERTISRWSQDIDEDD